MNVITDCHGLFVQRPFSFITITMTYFMYHISSPAHQQAFFAKLIHQGWVIVLSIWQLCNYHLHLCPPPNPTLTKLQAAARHIFHLVNQDPLLQIPLTHTSMDLVIHKATH